MSETLDRKIVSATKWSSLSEIATKLVTPLTTMVLARLLTPEAFGVLTTASIAISFAEIFLDAGFQRYLIQHRFDTDDDLYKSTTVAFWSNIVFSLFLWIVIVVLSPVIARLVGNEGYGLVIAIASICIPIEAFSSVQMALFRRKLDFKTLFNVRIVGILVPVFVTIPLAFFTHSYWSLIIGMIVTNVSNAVLLTIKSNWKPSFFFNKRLLNEMLSFSLWSMVEAITVWMTGYLDVFIVGSMLNTYYMGIYRTSITTVGAVMAIITSTTSPILFASLSSLQNDEFEFKRLFFRFQRIVSLLLIPICFGLFIFRDLFTTILLGNQWQEASFFIGWWSLTSAFTIIFSNYCAEVFRAKGVPKMTVATQCIHLLFLVPTVMLTVHQGFETLCLSRSLIRITLIIPNLILLYKFVHISFVNMVKNIWHYLLASIPMFLICRMIVFENIYINTVVQVLICSLLYLCVLLLFPEERSLILNLKKILRKQM